MLGVALAAVFMVSDRLDGAAELRPVVGPGVVVAANSSLARYPSFVYCY